MHYFFLCLLICFVSSLSGSNRISRHYFGENGTLPGSMSNLGTVNVQGSVSIHQLVC